MRKHFAFLAALLAITVGCRHQQQPVPHPTPATPTEADLVGVYRHGGSRGDLKPVRGYSPGEFSEIVLRADHAGHVTDLPQFGEAGSAVVCKITGAAEWQMTQTGSGWELQLTLQTPSLPKPSPRVDAREGQCQREVHLQIVGNGGFNLFLPVGTATRNTGIEYHRVSP